MLSGSRQRRGRGAVALGLVAALIAYGLAVAPDAPAETTRASAPVANDDAIRHTEEDAFARAIKSGQRTEIGQLRGESRSVFADPDGTITAVEYAQPVRVLQGGNWVPVDATLVATPDGTLRPRAATFGIRLSGGGDGALVEAQRAGRRLALEWPAPLPTPTVAGDQATYAEVLPGVDLVVSVGVSDFSHLLVVKNAKAASHPALAEIEFGLETAGLVVRQAEHGGLAAVDAAAGGAVFEAAAPTMWDSADPVAGATSSGSAQQPTVPVQGDEVPLDIRVTGNTLTLVPDRGMLTSPETRWPVVIDPVWTDTRASAWTMVASGHKNEEYWKFDKKPAPSWARARQSRRVYV